MYPDTSVVEACASQNMSIHVSLTVRLEEAADLNHCLFAKYNMADKSSSDNGAAKLTHLPIARIKTIMKSSPDLPNCSQESVFLVTRATVSCTYVY